MKFIDNNLPNHTGTHIDVCKNSNGVTIMEYKDTQYWLDNDLDYANLYLGGCSSCNPFFKNNFNNFNYDSVLVVGLGIGLLPLSLYEDKNCKIFELWMDANVKTFANYLKLSSEEFEEKHEELPIHYLDNSDHPQA